MSGEGLPRRRLNEDIGLGPGFGLRPING